VKMNERGGNSARSSVATEALKSIELVLSPGSTSTRGKGFLL
jgi:hypothetical protein